MRTSPSSIGKHFKTEHHAIYMQRPYKDKERSTSQQTLQACFNKADADHSFDDVVDMFIHHPGLSLSLCDSPRFKKVLKLSAGASKVNFRSVRGAIIDKDEKLFAQLKAKLHGRKVGIQIDGGKTVSNTKILGICVVVDRQCFCFGVEEVDDASILTETYYCNLLLNLVNLLESLGAIVVSITLDNEAAPNAGVRMLQRSKPHLIHNRCYPHTAELLVNDLQSLGTRQHPTLPAIPMLHTVNENVHNLVTSILNSKYLRAALKKAQRDRAVTRPLTLVKPANTRKWSTGFLMLARFCKLYDDIVQIETHLAAGANPEQSEKDAKATWQVQKLQIPPRAHCEAVRELLYWIYVGEQAMQKDGASVIHATFIFEEICCALEAPSTMASHRVPRIIQTNMNAESVQSIVQARRDLLQSSEVYWLSLCLWPKAQPSALDHHAEATTELECFVQRCWPQWQTNRVALGLHSRYHCDLANAADTRLKLDDFINNVQEELSKHLVIQDEPVIVRAQASFESRSALVATRLIQGDRVVKRGRIEVDGDDDNACAHVHQYWAAVASKLPLLAMIARLLLACCASEAAVERMFSKEGFIHSSYRIRLGSDIMIALLRSCINVHALDDERMNFDTDSSAPESD